MLNNLFNRGLNPLFKKIYRKNIHDVETINQIIKEDPDLNLEPVTVKDMEVLSVKRLFEVYTVNEIFNIIRYYQRGGRADEPGPVDRWQPVRRQDGKINCNQCQYLKKRRGMVYCEFYKQVFNTECNYFFNKKGGNLNE